MVRTENIISKIEAINKYLKLIQKYREMSFADLRSNSEILAATERFLYLICQAAIDLSEMIVKNQNLGKPESMSQNFDVLITSGYIDNQLGESLTRMVGFRNALSHGYENMDYAIMEVVLKNRIDDIVKFRDIVKKKENI